MVAEVEDQEINLARAPRLPFEEINGMTPYRAALTYAEAGWPVFPCKRDKTPLVPTGFKAATTDPHQVKAWWVRWPDASIGGPTGAVSGLWMLDVDVSNGKPGLASLATLTARYGQLETLEVRSGSGGRHLWFLLPEEGAPSAVGRLPGIDARGEGGYAILPPSGHPSGKKYQWEKLGTPIAKTPRWLADFLRRPAERDTAPKTGTVDGWGNAAWWHGGPIERGTRNQTLFRIACSAVARGYAEEAVFALVAKINHKHCTEPLGTEELEQLVASACKKSPAYQRTDVGNAKALAAHCAGAYVWVPEYKREGWHNFDGTRWTKASEKEVWREFEGLLVYWREMSRRLEGEGASLKGWVNACETVGKIRAAESLFGAEVETPVAKFNEGLDLLPLANGQTVFLGADGTYETRTSRLEDFSLNVLPIRYDAQAQCPTWDKAMKVWSQGNKEVEAFLWRWMGCLLTGRLLHHKMLVIVGPTKGGKTTLAETLAVLMGEFSVGMSVDLLTNARNFNKDAEKARLFAKRFAYFSEATSTSEFHVETLKNLMGEDTIHCRPLYGVAFNFDMSAKLLLHTNELPTAKQVDPAMENRLMFLEWCKTIPAEQRDPRLREKLVGEGAGWLNKALSAYQRVCRELGKEDGTEEKALAIPQSVLDAVARYRDDMDQVRLWLSDRCEAEPGNEQLECRRAAAWRSYTDWCRENRLSRGQMKAFYGYMQKHFRAVTVNGNDYFRGVKPMERVIVAE